MEKADIEKLHTTPLGVERIKRNLDLQAEDIAQWVKEVVKTAWTKEKGGAVLVGVGKNWYAYKDGVVITINAKSHTIITAHKIKATIRTMTEEDYPCLEEFLYQAIYIPEGEEWPPRSIVVDDPQIHIYIKDFGKQAGDLGVVAECKQSKQIIGAAWTRIIPAYGHLDDNTPELATSLFPHCRGCGIGSALMGKLFEILRQNGYTKTSLSVQKNNPAVRFYQRLGYKVTGERLDHVGHEDYLMVKKL